jgi:uncharacterized protein (DUF1778 family)
LWKELDVAVKTDRMEARVSPEERARIEQAAAVKGLSVSAFLVSAAVERADEVIEAATVTVMPADYFDALLAALDEPDAAPHLARAADRATRSGRISAR